MERKGERKVDLVRAGEGYGDTVGERKRETGRGREGE